MNNMNNTGNLNENLFGPHGTENVDPENYFAADQYKTRKCHIACVRCCAMTALCLGINTFSFYLGYVYAIRDDFSHSI